MFVVKKRCDGYDELIHTNYTVVFHNNSLNKQFNPSPSIQSLHSLHPWFPPRFVGDHSTPPRREPRLLLISPPFPNRRCRESRPPHRPRLYTQPPYRPLIVTLNPHSHPILSPCVVDRSMRHKENDPPRGGPTNHLSFYPLPLPASRSHRAPNTRWQVLFSDRREGRSGHSEKRRTTR